MNILCMEATQKNLSNPCTACFDSKLNKRQTNPNPCTVCFGSKLHKRSTNPQMDSLLKMATCYGTYLNPGICFKW